MLKVQALSRTTFSAILAEIRNSPIRPISERWAPSLRSEAALCLMKHQSDKSSKALVFLRYWKVATSWCVVAEVVYPLQNWMRLQTTL